VRGTHLILRKRVSTGLLWEKESMGGSNCNTRAGGFFHSRARSRSYCMLYGMQHVKTELLPYRKATTLGRGCLAWTFSCPEFKVEIDLGPPNPNCEVYCPQVAWHQGGAVATIDSTDNGRLTSTFRFFSLEW